MTDLPTPRLSNISHKSTQPAQRASESVTPAAFDASELAAKPPQAPATPQKDSLPRPKPRKPSMTDPEDDPWNTPEMHHGHNHAEAPRANGGDEPAANGHRYEYGSSSVPDLVHERTTSAFTTSTEQEHAPAAPRRQSATSNGSGWGYFGDANVNAAPAFGDAPSNNPASPFGATPGADRRPATNPPAVSHTRTLSTGRPGVGGDENIVVTLMPEKEGLFMFQHHNYEVTSARRGSKVIRRYSDFVWLLDCLHKRYPFRVLPLLPPKRVSVNGNHLSNDGAFIEKRRRGLARYLNAVVRHPVLGQEQLVIMFLTVPTVR